MIAAYTRSCATPGRVSDLAPSKQIGTNRSEKNGRAGSLKNKKRASASTITPIDYIYSPEFDQESADHEILQELETASNSTVDYPLIDQTGPKRSTLPAYLARLYDVFLLTPEKERDLFRRYNYLKFKATRLRTSRIAGRSVANRSQRIDQLLAEANAIKERLISANLRLVVSIAKKFVNADNSFDDLVSDGNLSLMRAVEKFNYHMGNRFSTYATYAIRRNFYRTILGRRHHRERFVFDEQTLSAAPSQVSRQLLSVTQVIDVRRHLEQMMKQLDNRERLIVQQRFGLDQPVVKSFKQLGSELGVCKERVRQIQARAIAKLRVMADDRKLDELINCDLQS